MTPPGQIIYAANYASSYVTAQTVSSLILYPEIILKLAKQHFSYETVMILLLRLQAESRGYDFAN